LVLRIEVQVLKNQIRTSSQIESLGSNTSVVSRNGMGVGMFKQDGKMLSNAMTSISSGEVYFHPPDDYRPDKRNGRIEIANLFSPYWDVRLIKTPMTERVMAWGVRDAQFLSDGARGVGFQGSSLSSVVSQSAQNSLGSYSRELSQSVQNSATHSARQFEAQFVDQITEQLGEGAINRAVSSFGF